ncbi:MAG TPA: acylphosphatase [Planctomycetota bacterium]|nr:acylphosphatase [Planctomycetota bacterium]
MLDAARPLSPQDTTARAHVIVTGRVQGVGFRAAARSEAMALGLVGWVRNCDNGSVEAAAEGPRPKVEEWVGWCRRGPAFARVANVEVTWEEAKRNLDQFDVRR